MDFVRPPQLALVSIRTVNYFCFEFVLCVRPIHSEFMALFVIFNLCLFRGLLSTIVNYCRSQSQRGLRRRSAAARLLRSWVRIPPGACIFVCCECCVLSGRGLCDELITRPEESYRLWCVVVWDLEISRMKRPWPALGRSATTKKVNY